MRRTHRIAISFQCGSGPVGGSGIVFELPRKHIPRLGNSVPGFAKVGARTRGLSFSLRSHTTAMPDTLFAVLITHPYSLDTVEEHRRARKQFNSGKNLLPDVFETT